MEQNKIERILEAVEGMKYSEWRKIAHMIDKSFEIASSRTRMSREDAERIRKMLSLEDGACPQLYSQAQQGEPITSANLRCTSFRPERLAKDVEHMPLPDVAP